jgi:hypothetical protein
MANQPIFLKVDESFFDQKQKNKRNYLTNFGTIKE